MKRCNGELRKLFRIFDSDLDGAISRSDFVEAFKHNNFGNIKDPSAAFDAIDTNGSGKVEYHEFCDVFYNNPRLNLVGNTIQTEQFLDSKAYKKLPDGTMQREAERVVKKLARKLKMISVTDKLMYAPTEHRTLREAFKRFDVDGSGFLTYGEFSKGIRSIAETNDFDESDLKLACVALDKNGDGAINYDEFLETLSSANALSGYDPFKAGRSRTLAALEQNACRIVDGEGEGGLGIQDDVGKSKRVAEVMSIDDTKEADNNVGDENESKELGSCTAIDGYNVSASTSSIHLWRDMKRLQRPRTAHADLFCAKLSKRTSSSSSTTTTKSEVGGNEEDAEMHARRRAASPLLLSSAMLATSSGGRNIYANGDREALSPIASKTRDRFFREVALSKARNVAPVTKDYGVVYRSPPLAITTRNLGLAPIRGGARASGGGTSSLLRTTSQEHYTRPKDMVRFVSPDRLRSTARARAKAERLKQYEKVHSALRRSHERRNKIRDLQRLRSISKQRLRYMTYVKSTQNFQFREEGKRSKLSILRREQGAAG